MAETSDDKYLQDLWSVREELNDEELAEFNAAVKKDYVDNRRSSLMQTVSELGAINVNLRNGNSHTLATKVSRIRFEINKLDHEIMNY